MAGPTIQSVGSDPDFLGLPQPEQLKVLGHIDSSFLGLPQNEQLNVLNTLTQPRKVASPIPAPPLTTVAKPQVNMQPMYLVGPQQSVEAGGKTVSEAAKGTLQNLFQVSAPGIVSSFAQTHPQLARFVPQALQRIAAPPEQLPAEMTTNFLLGAEPGERVPRAAFRAPEEAPIPQLTEPPRPPTTITPEAQAVYDKAVNKASVDFRDSAIDYNDKLNKMFDTAKRQQIEKGVDYDTAVKEAQDAHAEEVAKAKQNFEDATDKYNQAKAEHESQTVLAQRRQEILNAQPVIAEDMRLRAQEGVAGERAELDGRWNNMRNGIGTEAPTPIQNVVDKLNEGETKVLRGSPGSVLKFRQLATELGLEYRLQDADAATTPAGAFWTIPEDGSTTAPWQTLKVHADNIGRAMAGGDLGNVYPAMRMVRDAALDSLGQVAEAKGYGTEFRAVRAAEHQFRSDFEDLGSVAIGRGNPAARFIRAPNSAYAMDILKGKANDLLEQAFQRHPRTADLAADVRQMRDLNAELKSLGAAKAPPPFTAQPPTMQEVPAMEMPKRPGIPEKEPPESPQYPQVAPPVETPIAPKKLGPIGRAAAWTGGHMVGYSVGGWPGGFAGGKIATALAERLTQPPTPPTSAMRFSPAEYARQIMDDAKMGRISPGEANRRLTALGQSVKVTPLPK